MLKPWRRVRAIVEIPVQGPISERDLVWAVKILLEENRLHQRLMIHNSPAKTGRMAVKEFNRSARRILDGNV